MRLVLLWKYWVKSRMKKLLVIPFFIQHKGCPFTCAFCNQWKIAGEETNRPEEVIPRVEEYLRIAKTPSRVEVAFYGGSFSGLSENQQESWLEAAARLKQSGVIQGVRISTRPDYITNEGLRRLWHYGVTTIELGVQSLDDEVLSQAKRGHTASDTLLATRRIRKFPFELVYQLMLGLPGDNEPAALATAKKTVAARPEAVRIYPAVVLKDTLLASWYEEGKYQPWTLEQAVEVGAQWLGMFSCHGIKVIRMGLQYTANLTREKDLLAGPYHPAYGELVESRLMLKQLLCLFAQVPEGIKSVKLFFHPHSYSLVVGQRRTNAGHLALRWPDVSIEFQPDESLSRNDLRLQYGGKSIELTRQEFLGRYRIKTRE